MGQLDVDKHAWVIRELNGFPYTKEALDQYVMKGEREFTIAFERKQRLVDKLDVEINTLVEQFKKQVTGETTSVQALAAVKEAVRERAKQISPQMIESAQV